MALKININWDTALERCGIPATEQKGEVYISASRVTMKYLGKCYWVTTKASEQINRWFVEGHWNDLSPYVAASLQSKITNRLEDIIKDAEVEKMVAAHTPNAGPMGAPVDIEQVAAEVASDGPVALVEASKVLQPILGTSPGSIYHAIGVGSNFNVACRIKGSGPFDLAIRLEGGEGFDRVEVAKVLNMTVNTSGHVSLHLGLPKREDVSKVLGAVLFTLSSKLANTASLDEINSLFGKGK